MDSPTTSSTPFASNSFARLPSVFLVRTLTAYGEGVPSAEGSRSASATAMPWAPVPPMMRMSFFEEEEEGVEDEAIWVRVIQVGSVWLGGGLG